MTRHVNVDDANCVTWNQIDYMKYFIILAFISAPCLIRSMQHADDPPWAAQCNGVIPCEITRHVHFEVNFKILKTKWLHGIIVTFLHGNYVERKHNQACTCIPPQLHLHVAIIDTKAIHPGTWCDNIFSNYHYHIP